METNKKRGIYKHLLRIVETKGYAKDKAIEIARLWRKGHLLDKTIGDALFTETEQISDLVFRFYVYDFYVIEELGLFQLLRHYVRKGLAAALLYVGVDTPVVVIVNEVRHSQASKIEETFNKINRRYFRLVNPSSSDGKGMITTDKNGVVFHDTEGLLNAIVEIGCIYSEEEKVCVKVEPTKWPGIYRLQQLRCENCDARPECDLFQLIRHKSTEQSSNPDFADIGLWRKLYRYLKRVFGK